MMIRQCVLKGTLIEIGGIPYKKGKLESAKFVYDELRRVMLSVKDAGCGGCHNTECDHFIIAWIQLHVIGKSRLELGPWRNILQKDFVSDMDKEKLLIDGLFARFLCLRDLTLAFRYNITHFCRRPATKYTGTITSPADNSSYDFGDVTSIRFPVIRIGFHVDWENSSGTVVKIQV